METTVTLLPSGMLAGTGCIETGEGTNVVFSGGSVGQGLAYSECARVRDEIGEL